MTKEMEYYSQRIQVIAHDFYPPERSAVKINQTTIPQTEVVKHLILLFDFRLNWKEHIVKKENKST
jgi:hypothetical protein